MYKAGDRPVPGYRLVQFLGEGQFGEVWEAQGPGGILVALKLIKLDSHKGWTDFKGIFRVRDIRNPFLVTITGIWVLDDEGRVLDDEAIDDLIEQAAASSFVVSGRRTVELPTNKPTLLVIGMELCEKSLFDLLQETKGVGIGRESLLEYMRDAARGLDYLNRPMHRPILSSSRLRSTDELVSVRHCDVKPDNIMIVGGGAKICDFGLAQIADATGAIRKSSDKLQGTVPYMAPEVISGEGPSPATDQYALAITYYELRTGDIPFDDADKKSVAAVLDAHRNGRLDLSKLPEDEQRIIRKATSVKPKNRFASSGDFVEALKLERQPSRWGRAAALAAILAVAAMAAVVFMFTPDPIPSESPESLAENGRFVQAWEAVGRLPEEDREAAAKRVLDLQAGHIATITSRDLAGLADQEKASLREQTEATGDLEQILGWHAENAPQNQASTLEAEAIPRSARDQLESFHTQLLADLVDDAAALIDATPAGFVGPQATMLQQLAKDAKESQARHDNARSARTAWEAELLLMRLQARQLDRQGFVERMMPEVDPNAAKRQELGEALRSMKNRAESFGYSNEESPSLLILEALRALYDHDGSLSQRIDALARMQPLVDSLAQSEPMSGKVAPPSVPWGWSGSWEREQLDELKTQLHEQLAAKDAWWDGLEADTRQSVTTLWPDLAIPADAASRLAQEAATLRLELLAGADAGGLQENAEALTAIEAKLRDARGQVRLAASENEQAYLRNIEVEELCLWLSFPLHFRAQLANPQVQKSLASPTAQVEIWKEATDKLTAERTVNPLIETCMVEAHLLEPRGGAALPADHLQALARRAEDALLRSVEQGAWYRCYAAHALGVVLHELDQSQAAGKQLLDAFAWAEEDADGAALLAVTARRQAAATILVDAAGQRIGKAVSTGDGVSLGRLHSLAADQVAEPARLLHQARALASVAAPERDLHHLVMSFVQLRNGQASTVPDWRTLAERGQRLLADEMLKTDLEKWTAPVHAIIAEALRRGLDGSPATREVLEPIIENYAAAIGQNVSSRKSIESGALVEFYENVIEPAAQTADACIPERGATSPGNPADDPLAAKIAVIYRAQGIFINSTGYAIRDHLKAQDGSIDPDALALEALVRANAFDATARSLLEEGYARIRIGEAPQELAAKLHDLAERAKARAGTPADQFAAHELNAYALIHQARVSLGSGSGPMLLQAISEFDQAATIVRQLRQASSGTDFETELARVLIGLSTSRVEYCVAERPSRDEWMNQLRKAETSAREVVDQLHDRPDQHEAWIAWGNALEDMAQYCDLDQGEKTAHYTAAIEKFRQGEDVAADFFGSFSHARATTSLQRCNLRRVESGALPVGTSRQDELATAQKSLLQATLWYRDLNNSHTVRRHHAEALFWLGWASLLSADDVAKAETVDRVEEVWQQAASEVTDSQVSHWADYQLELAKYAWRRGDMPRAAEFAASIVSRANDDPVARTQLSNRRVVDAAIVAIAAQPNHEDAAFVHAIESAASRLPLSDRASLLAQECVYGLSWMISQRRFEDALFQRFQTDLQRAKQSLSESPAQQALAGGDGVVAGDVAEAWLKTAEGAVFFLDAFLHQRGGIAADWNGVRDKLGSAIGAWKELGPPSSAVSGPGASGGVAVAVNEEMEYFAKRFLVETNRQLLRIARASQKKAEWDALDRQVVEMLDTTDPREKSLRDRWTDYTVQFPSP